jgi:hypothetical protein
MTNTRAMADDQSQGSHVSLSSFVPEREEKDDENSSSAGSSGNEEASTGWCDSQIFYESQQRSKLVLFAMCIGLRASSSNPESRWLSDFSIEPYKSSKDKRLFKPTQKHLLAELLRRQRLREANKQRIAGNNLSDDGSDGQGQKSNKRKVSYKNKSITELRAWLMANPLTNPADVNFVRAEEKNFTIDLLGHGRSPRLYKNGPPPQWYSQPKRICA